LGGDAGKSAHGRAGKHPKKLIQAVVDYAYGEGNPPPELKLSWQCERYHCLPDAGAYLDQDYCLMVRMTAFSNISSVINKWKNVKGKDIHTLTDSDRRVLRALKDMGVMFL
jgi:hypothetical protein